MDIDSKFENVARRSLYKHLSKLSTLKLKSFYVVFVHYWADYKLFINKQNLYNLWCELNWFCHEFDESFPEQYDNLKEMESFYGANPYYFIDILPTKIIAALFSEFVDNHIDILINIARILFEFDIHDAYAYVSKALGLNEHIDILVSETQDHIKYFS